MNNQVNAIIKSALETAIPYESYDASMEKHVADGTTSGTNQSESYIHYTKMNASRMKRWNKTLELNETSKAILQSVDSNQTWLIITEAWCGDAAHILPVIAKMGDEANVDLKVVYRDEHPELMEHFLTDGGQSIPIIICLDKEMNYISHWGPRPTEPQKMVLERKAQENPEPYDTFSIKLQKWYSSDKGQAIQEEFLASLRVNSSAH